MPRILISVFLAVLVALAPGQALAYNSSQTATGTTDGAARTFTFSNLPQSNGDVSIAVFLRGDFNASSEYAAITADGNFLGNYSPTATYNSNSNCRQGTTTFTVPASYVADGSLSVVVDATSQVDYGPCEPWTYTVTVTYDDNTPPTITSIGNVTTNEDTATSTTFTVGDAETADSNLVVTATSNNQAVLADAGLSLSGTTGSRTLAIAPVPDAFGVATVTVTVTDAGGLSAVETFDVTVAPVNDPPLADAGGPYSGDEGSAVSLDGSGSGDLDGTVVGWAWDCDNDGTYETASPTATGATCTFPNDGTYTIGLQVTDDGGLVSGNMATATVGVGNVAPTAAIAGPSIGDEGTAQTWTFSGTDPSPVDQANLSFAWTITEPGGGTTTGTGASATYTPANSGGYTVEVVVTDLGGAATGATTAFLAENVPPVAAIAGPATLDEASTGTWTLSATDPSPLDVANMGYAWEVDNGTTTVGAGTGSSVSWTPTDDGSYTLTATATDPDGGTDTETWSITVNNVAPTVTASGPTTGDEGSQLTFSASPSDVSSVDAAALSTDWDAQDAAGNSVGGTIGSTSFDWTPADDGTYTVIATTTDPQGASASDSVTVTVGNIDPTITSTPGSAAPEGVLYSYAPTVTDPGNETFTWSLSGSAPAGMTIDAGTGLVEWTPTYADAVAGTAATVLTVDDGDGGTDQQTISLVVDVQDDDMDGLADTWETNNGLDPTDPNDASDDPDLDGMTNYDEYVAGTDPNVYDGPAAPVLTTPIAGEEVSAASPDLFWTNAVDPQGEVLTYTVEVYEDAALTTLLTSATAVAEDASGTSTWKVDVLLTENAEIWWRARATDAWVDGPWSTEESFVVNALNEAPDTPVLTAPIGGETAATVTPTLSWSEAADIDGDALSYEVEVWDEDGALVASAADVLGDGLAATWTVDVDLAEDAVYTWTARAVDDEGLVGDWAQEEAFFVSADNGAPSDVVFVAPLDGSVLPIVAPTLEVTESNDPEGGAVRYRFEIDTVSTFDSGDYVEVTVDDPWWDLAADGEALPEDTTVFARARAIDEADIASQPDTISFFVAGTNDPPSMPELVAPMDGAEGDGAPTLEVTDPVDPEGGVVYVEFIMTRDPELTDVVATGEVVVSGEGTTVWTVDASVEGTVYWTARARDGEGATTAWADAWTYVGPTEAEVPVGDDDDGEGSGCSCQSSVGGGSASAAWLLALVPAVLLRRRR